MILVLSDLWLPFPGGAERLMFNLGRDLCRRGEQVVAFTGYECPQRFDGPDVYRADIPLDADGWARIAHVIGEWHPDVIITHHIYARRFEHELLATGIPIVQVVLNGARIEGADLAVYISQHVADRAVRQPDDMIITPPAFDDVIADTHRDGIGFIKPIEHKGVELFYAIAERLPGRRFVVLRGEWQTLEDIRELPNVEYLQPVDDIRDFYTECSIVLVPSRSEDAGTVAQEATLNGLPCISSNVDGLAQTNGGGIQLDRDDLDGWVTAIESLDVLTNYLMAVRAQREHLDATDRDEMLDEFAARIRLLSARPVRQR